MFPQPSNPFLSGNQIHPGPNVICDTLNVLGATYANCDGRYKYTDEQVDWAPERPVFKHVTKDRYIFWNAHGLGWLIGKRAYLTSGSHFHESKKKLRFQISSINYIISLWKI